MTTPKHCGAERALEQDHAQHDWLVEPAFAVRFRTAELLQMRRGFGPVTPTSRSNSIVDGGIRQDHFHVLDGRRNRNGNHELVTDTPPWPVVRNRVPINGTESVRSTIGLVIVICVIGFGLDWQDPSSKLR